MNALTQVFCLMFLFGEKKLPELASGLGKAIKNFRDASNEKKKTDFPSRTPVTEVMGGKSLSLSLSLSKERGRANSLIFLSFNI